MQIEVVLDSEIGDMIVLDDVVDRDDEWLLVDDGVGPWLFEV